MENECLPYQRRNDVCFSTICYLLCGIMPLSLALPLWLLLLICRQIELRQREESERSDFGDNRCPAVSHLIKISIEIGAISGIDWGGDNKDLFC
jgi:hypothetical protein